MTEVKGKKCPSCKLIKTGCICGAPRKIKNVEQVLTTWKEYIDQCDKEDKIPSKAGWLLALGFSDRTSYNKYKKRQEYAHTLKRIDMHIEEAWAQRLKGNNVTGVIFYLKNAFREEYQDSSKIQLDGRVDVNRKTKDSADSLISQFLNGRNKNNTEDGNE